MATVPLRGVDMSCLSSSRQWACAKFSALICGWVPDLQPWMRMWWPIALLSHDESLRARGYWVTLVPSRISLWNMRGAKMKKVSESYFNRLASLILSHEEFARTLNSSDNRETSRPDFDGNSMISANLHLTMRGLIFPWSWGVWSPEVGRWIKHIRKFSE